ncbi:MAG: translocation/assembly module TamB domain-containing protein [Bacteroidota bacterium]
MLYLPSFQTYVAQKLTAYLKSSYGIDASIDKVKIRFVKTVELDGVFVKDLQGDTLLYAKNIEVNLAGYSLDQNTFLLDHFTLNKSRLRMEYQHPDSLSNLEQVIALFDSGDTTTTPSQPFHLEAQDIAINDLHFSLHHQVDTTHEFGMDYEDLDIKNFTLHAQDFALVDDSVNAEISLLRAREKSGLVLASLSGDLIASPTVVQFTDLRMVTPRTHIKGSLKLTHKSWGSYIDFVHQVKMKIDLEDSKVYSGDIAIFAPELKEWDKTIFISGGVRGKVDNLKLKGIYLTTMTGTEFAGNFDISGLPDFETSFITVEAQKIRTNAADIQSICTAIVDTSIVIPEEVYNLGDVYFAGSFTGFPNQFTSYGVFTSDAGVLKTDLTLQQKDSTYFYKGKLFTEGLDVGMVTGIADIGTLTSSFNVEGKGFAVEELDAKIDGTFDSFFYKDYEYEDIFLDGTFEKAKFNGLLTCEDPNADFDFNGEIDFNSEKPIFDFYVQVYAFNLSELNLMNDSIGAELSGTVRLRAEGYKLSDVTGSALIENLSYCQGENQYYFSKAEILAKNNPREIQLLSPIADVSIKGNFVPEELAQSFISVVADAIPAIKLQEQPLKKKKPVPQNFTFGVTVKDISLLKEFVTDSIRMRPGSTINGFYNSVSNVFELNVDAPYLRYADYRGRDVNLTARKINDVLSADLRMSSLSLSDSVKFNNIDVLAKAINDNLQFSVAWANDDKNRGRLEGVGQILGTTKFNVELLPADLLLDGVAWKTTQQATIYYDSTKINVKNFHLVSANQEVSIDGRLSQLNSDRMNFEIKNFDLHTVNSFYPIGYNVSGKVDGKGYVSNPYKSLSFQANVTVKALKFNEEILGNIVFDGNWARADSAINILAYLEKENAKTFNLQGTYRPFAKNNEMDMKLSLNNFNLVAVNALGIEAIDGFKGLASGAIDISGASEAPVLKGQIQLKDAQIHVDYLNTTYKLNDKIKINPDWIGFNRIVVTDEKGNKAYATGTANHKNFSNWNYDFSIDMKDFLCINTDATMNESFYGTAYASGDVNISGFNSNIDIEVKAKTRKGTLIAIPLGGAQDVSTQQLVRFVSTNEPMAIEEESDLSGITLKFDIEATEDAEVQLIFDEKIGDIISGKGNGRINLEITPSGDFRMFGRYEIAHPNYLFTLKNVVNKLFTVRPGGTITWYGDPYEAYIDLTAVYNARAALYDIMLTEDERYRRRELINCIMHMTGKLMEPRIKFDIAVPGADDFVRGQLAAVTSDENELNKQFLSLLVANRFSPLQNGVRSGENTAGSAVGSNSMELLSNQLSNWLSGVSNRFTVGVNLRPGDQTSTGEYSLMVGTQLFKDRVNVYTNVGVGSTATTPQTPQNANNFVGDVVVEYNLTKDGRFKLKAFNQTSDNVYISSGLSPYVQGAGISYSEQFDSFSEFRRNFVSLFERRKKKVPVDITPPTEVVGP